MAEHNPDAERAYLYRLHRKLALYVLGVLGFVGLMVWAEQHGLSRQWIGPSFLFLTVMVYAAIGVYSRTADPEEYYVAGRRIPPFYNGMATAADWMSAASFISLSGALYLQGFAGTPGQGGGLAYLLGWTGGFCLVALLIAPHLRAMELYTVPEFFQMRFGGHWPRRIVADFSRNPRRCRYPQRWNTGTHYSGDRWNNNYRANLARPKSGSRCCCNTAWGFCRNYSRCCR